VKGKKGNGKSGECGRKRRVKGENE